MLDFTKEDLYKGRQKEFDAFLDHVLMTQEERDALEQEAKEKEVSEESFMEAIDEMGGIDNYLDEKKEDISESSIFLSDKELGTPYEMNDYWKNLGVSPYYLFYYISRSIGKNLFTRNMMKMKTYLKSLAAVSSVTFLFATPLVLFTEAKFLFSLEVLSIISLLLFIASWVGLYFIQNPMTFARNVESSEGFEEKESINFDELENGQTDIEESFDETDDIDKLLAKSGIDEDVMDVEEVEDVELVDTKVSSYDGSPIVHSPVDVRADYNVFLDQLKSVYMANEHLRGVKFPDRKDLVMSLSGYLISNDKTFGTWDVLTPRGVVFNNIMYMVYLSLVAIDKRFKERSDSNKIVVMEAKENPVMYKIVFETNEDMFKIATLKARESVFKDMLKNSDSDMETGMLVSGYGGTVVLKLFKPVKGFVSLGDILRYHNDDLPGEQAYEHFLSDKMGLPLVLGLKDNEYPTVVDLADNTSVVVAGESGSGKSWGTFLMMENMVLTNDPNDLNLIIMDRKKAVFWREFARLPHVIGYHTNVPDYFDILKEIKAQMETRKLVLEQAGFENWKGLRKSLRSQGKIDQLSAFPWLVVVMDEVSNTMNEVSAIAGTDNKHIMDSFVADLATLAQEARSLGIKLVLIGQRTVDKSMPKNNLVNSSLKFFFKLQQSDMELGGFTDKNLRYPALPGQALLKDFNLPETVFLRTLTVGGIEDEQIMNMFRMLAFEWHRRFDGKFIDLSKVYPFTFNRDKIQAKVADDLRNEKFFVGGDSSGTSLDALADSLMAGSFSVDGSNELVSVQIEKEDARGNEVPRVKRAPEVKIITDDDVDDDGMDYSDLADMSYSDFDDSDLEIADDSDDDSFVGYDDDGLPIYRDDDADSDIDIVVEDVGTPKNVTREGAKSDRSASKSVPRGRVVGQPVMRRNGTKSGTPNRRVAHENRTKVSNVNGGVSGKVDVTRRASNLPVHLYIEKYGEGVGRKFLSKEALEQVYSRADIETALNNVKIMQEGEFYYS